MPKIPKRYKTLLTECTPNTDNINFLQPDAKQEETNYILRNTNIKDISQIQNDTASIYNTMVNNNIINKNDNIKDTLFTCNCGDKVLLIHKLKHARTAKHREYIKNSIQNNNDRKKTKARNKANEQRNNEINELLREHEKNEMYNMQEF